MPEAGITCIECGTSFRRGETSVLYHGNYCDECRDQAMNESES